MKVKQTVISGLLLLSLQATADTDIEGIGGTGAHPGEDGFGGTGKSVDSQRPELPGRPELLDLPRVERPELERPEFDDGRAEIGGDTNAGDAGGELPETPED